VCRWRRTQPGRVEGTRGSKTPTTLT
jgi:hypothetical protein